MEICWNIRHSEILSDLFDRLNSEDIKYFVLRNYKELPENNPSKDVDIILEPGKISTARECMMQALKKARVNYYNEEIFGHIHSFWGMDTEDVFSIHIDLIEGYYAKGFSVFTFNELYEEVEKYKNFYVLNDFFSGVMLYVYKQFGYRKPRMKTEYCTELNNVIKNNKSKFEKLVAKLTTEEFAKKAAELIVSEDFEGLLKESCKLQKYLKLYVWKKRPITTMVEVFRFYWQRLHRILFSYRSYSYNFAVIAPDGGGKTTFLEILINDLNFYRVCTMEDNHISVYHFRPGILPNLGAMGEKAGIKKQDTDFTDPHRNAPANPISSFVRMVYYIIDYIVGWQIRVRRDVHRNKWTIFDRYSYDLMVDPKRTRLNLPDHVRSVLVGLTPKPNIVFLLKTTPEIIFKRKQELTLREIERQLNEYTKLAKKDNRIVVLDAEKSPEELAKIAIKHLFERYMNCI